MSAALVAEAPMSGTSVAAVTAARPLRMIIEGPAWEEGESFLELVRDQLAPRARAPDFKIEAVLVRDSCKASGHFGALVSTLDGEDTAWSPGYGSPAGVAEALVLRALEGALGGAGPRALLLHELGWLAAESSRIRQAALRLFAHPDAELHVLAVAGFGCHFPSELKEVPGVECQVLDGSDTAAAAVRAADRLLAALEQPPARAGGRPLPLGAAGGGATLADSPGAMQVAEEALRAAEEDKEELRAAREAARTAQKDRQELHAAREALQAAENDKRELRAALQASQRDREELRAALRSAERDRAELLGAGPGRWAFASEGSGSGSR